MIYLFLSRSITWPFYSKNNKSPSILDENDKTKTNSDESQPLISNKDLLINNNDLSKNLDETKSLIEKDRISDVPSPKFLSILGKHYLTREDLENMIQTRFKQETPKDRIRRFLWKE